MGVYEEYAQKMIDKGVWSAETAGEFLAYQAGDIGFIPDTPGYENLDNSDNLIQSHSVSLVPKAPVNTEQTSILNTNNLFSSGASPVNFSDDKNAWDRFWSIMNPGNWDLWNWDHNDNPLAPFDTPSGKSEGLFPDISGLGNILPILLMSMMAGGTNNNIFPLLLIMMMNGGILGNSPPPNTQDLNSGITV